MAMAKPGDIAILNQPNMYRRLLQSNQPATGFSLIELIVTIAIISILAYLAGTQYRIFKIKAYQTEGRLNIQSMHALQLSYHAETGEYANVTAFGDAIGNAMIGVPVATACADNGNNPLGFAIPNCAKSRYVYSATVTIGPPMTVAMGAANGSTANPNVLIPSCIGGQDQFIISYEGLPTDGVLRHIDLLKTRPDCL